MIREVFSPFFRLRLFASARFKLVLAFVGVLAVALTLFSSALIVLVHFELYGNLNNSLVTEGNRLADLIELNEGELLYAELENLNLDEERGLRSLAIQMFDKEGNVIWRASRNQLPPSDTVDSTANTGETKLINMSLPFERYRVLTLPIKGDSNVAGILQVGLSLKSTDNAFNRLLLGLLVTVPGALILVAALGLFLSSKILRPIEQSVAKQRQFIQDASHELRTPLAIMQSNIDVTLQNPNPTVEQLRGKLKTIGETTTRMSKIISDLFELSNSDSHSMRFKNKLVELDRVAKDFVKQTRSLVKKKKHTLELKNTEQLVAFMDEDRIKQVLTILIDNALKYTTEGTNISLNLSKTPGVDYAKLSVEDNGPGISKLDQAKIFERFYRVDKSRSREIGGTGLGLSIAQTIIRKQRGYITVNSKLGEGTRFDIFLPLVSKKIDPLFKLPNILGGFKSRDDKPKEGQKITESKQ